LVPAVPVAPLLPAVPLPIPDVPSPHAVASTPARKLAKTILDRPDPTPPRR
jgi:hypothetical protein